jgi:flavin reductase (DIM6/NTAB) family NADH-FMN oxidoreductase RutF
MNLMFKISYGLYVLCGGAEGKDGGCIVNTLVQQSSSPELLSVTANKLTYTHKLITESGKCAVALLSTETTFDFIKNFGFQSGKDVDKFAAIKSKRTQSGILVPITDNVIGYFDFKVENSVDFGSHTMFVLSCKANEAFRDAEPLTYNFYQSSIKPKPQIVKEDKKERWVCKICGYIHEGPLPADFICPICKHPASDFERLA